MRDTEKILQKDREEQGDAHELLTSSCDDSRARLVRMAVYDIREVRASERVSERASPRGESEHPRLAFYRQDELGYTSSAQLHAIRIATVVHGYTGRQDGGRCLICMQRTMSHLHARCMQMDDA